ncbi:putative rhamnogalacturonase [Pseudovirgaria hyperparasitica]|uniref:rhamnogalacturonan endolyase n=1 Tax=Pseudovirgaria hyperparasitica TaxID=470096 RepID=A0A6A6W052_9PEZI|nr:putative rhamnogalacturonase [Pseudovirgaria hyperparasitica]KAF2754441.1 putative rhamnogalacturonase [Pseudovirgaria hyperparasitica]
MWLQSTVWALLATAAELAHARGPFLQILNATHSVIGNDHWNVTQGFAYATKLYHKNQDLVGNAVGHYVSYSLSPTSNHPVIDILTVFPDGAASDLNWTSPTIVRRGHDFIDVSFTAIEGDFHWIIRRDLVGAYQYFVNRALPTLGEFRSLWRLDNTSFPNGHTSIKDEALPPLSDYGISTKIQDETWQRADGSYITKYDWSSFIREEKFYGVYGPDFGSWYIYPGKDEYNGDHLKQELMVHRESSTGDAVQLNMLHGTHFQSSPSDTFAVGKTWGPWLWYLNDGNKRDAAARAAREYAAWPYKWFDDAVYQSRGAVSGVLKLDDGSPASNAAIFLGDNNSNKSSLEMGSKNYYTTYADERGRFSFRDVRAGTYGLRAWSTGGRHFNVPGFYLQNDVSVVSSRYTDLGRIVWKPRYKERSEIFRVGSFDRKTIGFAHGGAPYTHGSSDLCPDNLNYTVGRSRTEDWCFAQTANGSWAVNFEMSWRESVRRANSTALLTVSLAGYSTGTSSTIFVNDAKVGNLTSGGGSTTDYNKGLQNDPGLYRSATTAGQWRQFEFELPSGSLKAGWNRLEFRVERSTRWRGFMWDAVALAWL